jgi:hypothetical protein
MQARDGRHTVIMLHLSGPLRPYARSKTWAKACLWPLLASFNFESSYGTVSISDGKGQHYHHFFETIESYLSLLILTAVIQCGFDVDR